MGLFDTVRCEYPLPDLEHQRLEFQTKSLECTLDEYVITRDGRLMRRAGRALLSDRDDRPALHQDVEWPMHGDVEIYTSRGADDWAKYLVRFTHGRVE